jgi:hypothetical protein
MQIRVVKPLLVVLALLDSAVAPQVRLAVVLV